MYMVREGDQCGFNEAPHQLLWTPHISIKACKGAEIALPLCLSLHPRSKQAPTGKRI